MFVNPCLLSLSLRVILKTNVLPPTPSPNPLMFLRIHNFKHPSTYNFTLASFAHLSVFRPFLSFVILHVFFIHFISGAPSWKANFFLCFMHFRLLKTPLVSSSFPYILTFLLKPFLFLLPKTFILFVFKIFWLLAHTKFDIYVFLAAIQCLKW